MQTDAGKEIIERYITFARAARNHRYSDNTERAIQYGLKQFFEWWGPRPLEEFDRHALDDYKEYLWAFRYDQGGQRKGYSIATINQRLIVLRRFCEVCRDDWGIHVKAHPMAETVEIQNIEAALLEVEHVKKLAAVAKREYPEDYALVLGLFYTGARISELMQVTLEAVGRPEVLVKGKGRKYRRLFMTSRLARALRDHAKQFCPDGQGALYRLESGAPMTRGAAHWRLHRLAKAAGVADRRVHPHAFRHLYARQLQEGGVPTAIIKQILGHRLDTTEGYLQFSREKLFEIIERVKL